MWLRRRKHQNPYPTELILNSLVDIALCLVIGFMIAMPLFFETGIFVSAPGVAKAAPDDPNVSDIKASVFLSNDGRILLNDVEVTQERLTDLLPKLIERSPSRRVVISTGDQVSYARTMRVLDLAKQNGAADLALLRNRSAQ
jgi:biopolymer transport protein ExbD